MPNSMTTPSHPPPPPQPASTLAPLTIAKTFCKQYYKTLSSNPSTLSKFYSPHSQLSHSHETHLISHPRNFFELPADNFLWAKEARVDFTNGSIDAQYVVPSKGILVMVTGVMILSEKSTEFVQTFILAEKVVGKKRTFYVSNDVLRFLTDVTETNDEEEEEEDLVEKVELEEITASTFVSTDEEEIEVETNNVVVRDEPPPAMLEHVPTSELLLSQKRTSLPDLELSDKLITPPLRALEIADKMIAPPPPLVSSSSEKKEIAPLASVASTDKSIKTPSHTSTKPPGSWASLVAKPKKNNNSTTVNAPIPSDRKKKSTPTNGTSEKIVISKNEEQAQLNPEAAAATRDPSKPTAPSTDSKKSTLPNHPKSSPQEPSSLYIKNISDKITQHDLKQLFAPHQDKILNINLYPTRGFAFVDFESHEAVTAVMLGKNKMEFTCKECVLEVEKKSGKMGREGRAKRYYKKAGVGDRQYRGRREGGGRSSSTEGKNTKSGGRDE